ncbi:MAG: hypothetical protein ACFFAS_10425 [Promethearchaeota archaeon]
MNKGTKLKDKLDKFFHKIFNQSHLFYTIVFLLIALILGVCSFNSVLGNLALFLATNSFITFIFLVILGIPSNSDEFLFSPERIFDKKKIGIFLGLFFFSIIIVGIYFVIGTSEEVAVAFLGWDILLPITFIIIYFGWNVIQIFFIKTAFENISLKVNDKLINSNKIKNTLYISFLLLGIIIPLLMQSATFIGYWQQFENTQEALNWFVGWNIVMIFVIALISWRLIYLYHKSKKNDTPNIFSSVFHILIWFIIWFRSFSFIHTFQGTTESTGTDIFKNLMNVLLMVLTAIMVLRGLGRKVYKIKVFNPNNLPFFLFAFTLLYIEGQVILITGAGTLEDIFSDPKDISLVNNFIVLIVTIVFYWWYSEYTLERRGLIIKNSFIPDEVIEIVYDFKDFLNSIGAVDQNKISEADMERFFLLKKIVRESIENQKNDDPSVYESPVENKNQDQGVQE